MRRPGTVDVAASLLALSIVLLLAGAWVYVNVFGGGS